MRRGTRGKWERQLGRCREERESRSGQVLIPRGKIKILAPQIIGICEKKLWGSQTVLKLRAFFCLPVIFMGGRVDLRTFPR